MKYHVIFSGGLDSTVALYWAADKAGIPNTRALSFKYGQRHEKELESALTIASNLNVPLEIRELQNLLHSKSLMANSTDPIPTEAYDAESMESTEVQGRNMLFASLAVAGAARGDVVVLGVHGGDHALYPDCRPEFWEKFSTIVEATYGVQIVVPFLHSTKAGIVAEGVRLDAPMGLSWSCYQGGLQHCGECGTCMERREAYYLAGVPDPTRYEHYF